MSNREIRAWTSEAIRGNIGFLLLISFICSLPTLIWLLVYYSSYGRISPIWSWAVSICSSLLNLGGICVVLKLIWEEKRDLATLNTPFTPDYVSKSLMVILFLSLLTVVGKYLFRRGLLSIFDEGLIGLPSALLQLAIATVLFPISYMLFFFPDWPVGQVISQGLRAGYEHFWNILSFMLALVLPILTIVLLMVLSYIFVSVLTVFIWIFGGIGLVLYNSYIMLARGKYAIERFMQ